MTTLLAILAFGTMGAVAVMGYISAEQTRQRLVSDTAPKSTLAADTPNRRKPARSSRKTAKSSKAGAKSSA